MAEGVGEGQPQVSGPSALLTLGPGGTNTGTLRILHHPPLSLAIYRAGELLSSQKRALALQGTWHLPFHFPHLESALLFFGN